MIDVIQSADGPGEELILSTVHLNCLPHGNILTDHAKHMYMSLNVSHTVSFIRVLIHKKLEEAVFSQEAEVRVETATVKFLTKEIDPDLEKKKEIQFYYQIYL